MPQNCLNSEDMFPHPLRFHNQHLLNMSMRSFLSESSVCDFCAPGGLWNPILLGESTLFKLSVGER